MSYGLIDSQNLLTRRNTMTPRREVRSRNVQLDRVDAPRGNGHGARATRIGSSRRSIGRLDPASDRRGLPADSGARDAYPSPVVRRARRIGRAMAVMIRPLGAVKGLLASRNALFAGNRSADQSGSARLRVTAVITPRP